MSPHLEMTEQTNAIDVCDMQSHVRIDASVVRDWVARVLAREGRVCGEVSIVIVDDAAIQRINAQFLGHDWPTDCVTFPMDGPEEEALSGEVVVSAEMAIRQAPLHGMSTEAELALYVIHGLLHLCGCDDVTEADRDEMRRREAIHLAAFGLGFVDRASSLADGGMPCPA